MTCTRAQVLGLLELIREEMPSEECRRLLDQYIERIRRQAWSDIIRDLFDKP